MVIGGFECLFLRLHFLSLMYRSPSNIARIGAMMICRFFSRGSRISSISGPLTSEFYLLDLADLFGHHS